MSIISAFALACVFSFIGSIPPGSINLTIVQLGLEKRINLAWRFALAAAVVEYPYAWLAIKFKTFILTSPVVLGNMKLITAIVMIILGVIGVFSSASSSSFAQRFEASGFRRGILLGILNPLAIPYWLGITAYLEAQGWLDISTPVRLHSYLLGVSLGALFILMVFAYLATKVVSIFRYRKNLKKIPGFVLLTLGVYALVEYFL